MFRFAWLGMVRQYLRIVKMKDSRLTKKANLWDKAFSEQNNIQPWSREERETLSSHNLANYVDPEMNFCGQSVIVKLKESNSF